MSQNINIENYQEYLVDYFDNMLDDSLLEELNDFALSNKELEGIDIFLSGKDMFYLKGDGFEGLDVETKIWLKRVEEDVFNVSYTEYLALSYVEDCANEQEIADINQLKLCSEEFNNSVTIFDKCRLDKESIIYPNKKSLRRQTLTLTRKLSYIISGVAAIFFILLALDIIVDDVDNLPLDKVVVSENAIKETNSENTAINKNDINESVKEVLTNPKSHNVVAINKKDTPVDINDNVKFFEISERKKYSSVIDKDLELFTIDNQIPKLKIEDTHGDIPPVVDNYYAGSESVGVNFVRSLLVLTDRVLPLKFYKNNEERGVEIASLVRIKTSSKK